MAKDKAKPASEEPAMFSEDIKPVEELPVAALDPRDAEIAKLKAENEKLKAERGVYPTDGRKYRVSLKDGPTAVVKPEVGEHPFDAFKRLGGIQSSIHAPVIVEADEADECGTVLANGKVRPFAAA